MLWKKERLGKVKKIGVTRQWVGQAGVLNRMDNGVKIWRGNETSKYLSEECSRHGEQLEESLKEIRDHEWLVDYLRSLALSKMESHHRILTIEVIWSDCFGRLALYAVLRKDCRAAERSVRRNCRNASHLCTFMCRRAVMIPSIVKLPGILAEYWVLSKFYWLTILVYDFSLDMPPIIYLADYK